MTKLLTEIGGQDGVPILTPVTRREPPGGYKAPKYEDEDPIPVMTRAEYEAACDAESAKARAAVGRALTSYRWWGWTNIINTIRLWWLARRPR